MTTARVTIIASDRDGSVYHPNHPEIQRNRFITRSLAAKKGWRKRRLSSRRAIFVKRQNGAAA